MYLDLAHAMQSGVAAKMAIDPADTSPKHLRVGLNSAMVNDAALARLLIARGLFTEEEYLQAITDEMEREVARYKEWFKSRGVNVDFA
jgi:hypothetical protein